jgi:Sec-independent protein translocase protein TatA|tara:strand:- start:961 stop:1356 length:396 start_codon:yes stop_codon:yes gene_type:complete
MNMTQPNARLAFAGLFSLFLGLAAPLASAQSANPAPTAQPAAGAQAQQFGEKKLESFAESLGEIMEIREEFTGKLQQTEDANKARDLQQQANEKMLGVIEENDISIDEYNAINQAVQTDPELRNRVIAMMK